MLEVVYSPKSLHTAADELAAMYETVRALNSTGVMDAWDDKLVVLLSAAGFIINEFQIRDIERKGIT